MFERMKRDEQRKGMNLNVISDMLVFITSPYFLKLACKILRITEKDLLDYYEDSFVVIKREDEDVS